METIRWSAAAILTFFLAFTVYATHTAPFMKSFKTVLKMRWGQQIVGDLFLGLVLFHFFIYLNEGSILVTLAWFLASILLGNIATLFYFVLNFQSLVNLVS